MSAGSFLVACFTKSTEQLRSANIERAAKDHGIPVEWARYYLGQELSGRAA